MDRFGTYAGEPCRLPSRPMLSQETRLSVEPLMVDPMGYFVTSSLRTGSTAVVPASILAIARPSGGRYPQRGRRGLRRGRPGAEAFGPRQRTGHGRSRGPATNRSPVASQK